MAKPPPTHTPPAAPPLNNDFYCSRWRLSVDCCVLRTNGGHLRTTPLSSLYFLMGLCFAPQTGTGEVTVSSAQLAPTHCVVTLGATAPWVGGALLTFPWRERAKPLGGRAAAAHVGCCMFCIFVLWLWVASFSYQRYLICKKLISDQPKWPLFAHSYPKIHYQANLMIRYRQCPHGVRTSTMP